MRLAAEVVDPILLQFLLETGLAPPRGVLAAIVGEHLLGNPVLANRRAIHLQHVLGTLATEQVQSHDVARMVVDESDQVRILATQPKREDVRLPHLVGCAAFKESWLGWVLRRLPPPLLYQMVLVQRPPHRLVAAGQKQHPPQQLRNPLHAEVRMLLFQGSDLLLDRARHLRLSATTSTNQRLQPGFALFAIEANPCR